ncbi:MAG: hypothetical protein WB341_17985 [Terracidiphilus sp.]
MRIRRFGSLVLTVLAGFLGCIITGYGLLAVRGIDFHQDTVLSIFYCALPLLSLPVFFLAIQWRKLIPLQAILAIAWLAVYSALNWRTCAALGYCGSVASTVLLTLRTHSVLAYFGMAICSLAAIALRHRPGTKPLPSRREGRK